MKEINFEEFIKLDETPVSVRMDKRWWVNTRTSQIVDVRREHGYTVAEHPEIFGLKDSELAKRASSIMTQIAEKGASKALEHAYRDISEDLRLQAINTGAWARILMMNKGREANVEAQSTSVVRKALKILDERDLIQLGGMDYILYEAEPSAGEVRTPVGIAKFVDGNRIPARDGLRFAAFREAKSTDGRTPRINTDKVEKNLRKQNGETTDYNFAGFLLRDGTMTKWNRAHVKMASDALPFMDLYSGVERVLKLGIIRVIPSGDEEVNFELGPMKPTPAQMRTISGVLSAFPAVRIAYSSIGQSRVYESETRLESDIEHAYSSGELPRISKTARFHAGVNEASKTNARPSKTTGKEDSGSKSVSAWIKAKTGYTLFTGKDKTLSGYEFRGTPSVKNMGIPDWPSIEVDGYNDDFKERALADKFGKSTPGVMMVNHAKKSIALLPRLSEGGKHDRGHENGYDWIWRHAKNSKDWESLDGGSASIYIRDVSPETLKLALAIGFLDSGDELTQIMKAGGYKTMTVGKYLAGLTGENYNPELKTNAMRFISLLMEIHKLELRRAELGDKPSQMTLRAVEKALAEKLNDLSWTSHNLIDPDLFTYQEDIKALSDKDQKIIADSLGAGYKKLDRAVDLARKGDIDGAMVELSIGKQLVHRFTKNYPKLATIVFGSKEIAAELTRVSSLGGDGINESVEDEEARLNDEITKLHNEILGKAKSLEYKLIDFGNFEEWLADTQKIVEMIGDAYSKIGPNKWDWFKEFGPINQRIIRLNMDIKSAKDSQRSIHLQQLARASEALNYSIDMALTNVQQMKNYDRRYDDRSPQAPAKPYRHTVVSKRNNSSLP